MKKIFLLYFGLAIFVLGVVMSAGSIGLIPVVELDVEPVIVVLAFFGIIIGPMLGGSAIIGGLALTFHQLD